MQDRVGSRTTWPMSDRPRDMDSLEGTRLRPAAGSSPPQLLLRWSSGAPQGPAAAAWAAPDLGDAAAAPAGAWQGPYVVRMLPPAAAAAAAVSATAP